MAIYLQQYFAPEVIHGYHCDGCKQKVTIDKKVHVYKFPEVLIVFFKRFLWGQVPRKIKGKVVVPFDEIDLDPFVLNGQCKPKKLTKN